MASITLTGAVSICEELGINYTTDRNVNNPAMGKLSIKPNNEGMDYISITMEPEKYYFSFGYFRGNILGSGNFIKRWFTGNNMRALFQIVVGHPLYEVDADGHLDQFFAGLE